MNQSVGVRSKAEEILGSSDPLKHRGRDRTTARVKIIDKIPGGGNDRWRQALASAVAEIGYLVGPAPIEAVQHGHRLSVLL